VIQGSDGLAGADSKRQIIVAAQANGTVAQGQYFAAALEEAAGNLRTVSGKRKPLVGTTVVADRAYFSEDNVPAAQARGIPAIIPDGQCRQRDEAMKDGERRQGQERLDARHCK
jgi:hypothetical protein